MPTLDLSAIETPFYSEKAVLLRASEDVQLVAFMKALLDTAHDHQVTRLDLDESNHKLVLNLTLTDGEGNNTVVAIAECETHKTVTHVSSSVQAICASISNGIPCGTLNNGMIYLITPEHIAFLVEQISEITDVTNVDVKLVGDKTLHIDLDMAGEICVNFDNAEHAGMFKTTLEGGLDHKPVEEATKKFLGCGLTTTRFTIFDAVDFELLLSKFEEVGFVPVSHNGFTLYETSEAGDITIKFLLTVKRETEDDRGMGFELVSLARKPDDLKDLLEKVEG